MNPQDMVELKVNAGDLVEIYNDNGSTQAMVYPTATAKRKQTFMLFAYPSGVQGNVVSPGVNEFIIPNYKQTWGAIRKTCRCAGRRPASDFQVAGVRGRLIRLDWCSKMRWRAEPEVRSTLWRERHERLFQRCRRSECFHRS